MPATTGIKTSFYEYLDAALQYVPVNAENREVRARMARIGIGAGKTFEFKDLSLEHKAAVLLGMKDGDEKVDKWFASGLKDVNGWKIGSSFGDQSFYKGDWLMRAGTAKGGIYGSHARQNGETCAIEGCVCRRHAVLKSRCPTVAIGPEPAVQLSPKRPSS
ncbi:hypothetical protein ACIPRI_17595 [Variovorax sp. LARHSF232]